MNRAQMIVWSKYGLLEMVDYWPPYEATRLR